MADFLAVPSLDKLTAPLKAIDWFDDIAPQLGEGASTPGVYQVGPGTVTVTGRRLVVHACSTNTYNAGFPQGSRLLVAQPAVKTGPQIAVITIVFNPPVTDMGCDVGGVFKARTGDLFSARMWVYHTGSPGWDGLVSGTGHLADPVPAGGTLAVPFLGVRAVNGRKIERVGIEASLIGPVPLETVAISGLSVTP